MIMCLLFYKNCAGLSFNLKAYTNIFRSIWFTLPIYVIYGFDDELCWICLIVLFNEMGNVTWWL